MNNSFKGALPKDKTNSRSPTQSLSRRNSHDDSTKKSKAKYRENSPDECSSNGSLIGLGPGPIGSNVPEFGSTSLADDVSSGYELTPKPKVPCIPMFPESASLKAIRSFLLDGHNGAEVVYKGRDIEDSSLSVLFVGSKSRLDLQSCKPMN